MITVVEKLLSERFEGKVRLYAAEELRSGGRSKVSRFRVLEGPQCAPQSVINSHNARTLLEDHRWGISTMRQRALLRFDIFWKMSEDYGCLESVGATVRGIANKLRAQWPAEADAMPYYPAFRAQV